MSSGQARAPNALDEMWSDRSREDAPTLLRFKNGGKRAALAAIPNATSGHLFDSVDVDDGGARNSCRYWYHGPRAHGDCGRDQRHFGHVHSSG